VASAAFTLGSLGLMRAAGRADDREREGAADGHEETTRSLESNTSVKLPKLPCVALPTPTRVTKANVRARTQKWSAGFVDAFR